MPNRISGASRPAEGPALVLVRGPECWPIPPRPIQLGRLPECDVVVPGDSVSRVHAWIVPTPTGPLLVDQGRHGTSVNGALIGAPRALAEGDEITIGDAVFAVKRAPPGQPPPGPRLGGKIRRWINRYGPSEALGTVAAVGAAVGVENVTGNVIAGAYAGALAESIVFYGVMFLRESLQAAHHAGVRGRPFHAADLTPVAGNLVLEFGVAEALDLVVIRPLLVGLGLRWVGGHFGALAGKLAADLMFYGPVLAVYEWRVARRVAGTEARRRRTTATNLAPPAE